MPAKTGQGVHHNAKFLTVLDCQHTIVFLSKPELREALWCVRCDRYNLVIAVEDRDRGKIAS